ncbi:MAG TPA: TonB-dependent receptor [Bacteroidales bacterium]
MSSITKYFIILFSIFLQIYAISQPITQTVTGKVFDAKIQFSLPGATVVVIGSDPVIGTVTDSDGNFRLPGIPVGRISLLVSYVGYEDYKLPDVLVGTAEMPNLKVPMNELVTGLDEVEIKDKLVKEQTVNSMALLSARSISLDEAQRFAGSMEDFSRLASSFAGVTSGSIDNNEVIIRGNPAKGILWRLEGMEIPVPNHLAFAFNGGGVVSMFSPFMMANSDFFSGAFPAEYGNVLSGVFDINFRTGNPDEGKFGFLIGSYGVEAAAEGPFQKGGGSTYVANFRVSTFSILQNIMPIETGLPDYTDLSFNMNFPTKKAGVFSLWSLTGYGRIAQEPSDPPADWTTSWDNTQYKITYGLTASGLNHKLILGKKSLLSSSLSFSGYTNSNVSGQLDSLLVNTLVSDVFEKNYSIKLKTELNHKFGARHTNRTGILFSENWFNYNGLANSDPAIQDTFDFKMNEQGNTFTFQAFSQSLVQMGEKLSMNAGVNFLYFGLNGNFAIDPRISFKWQASATQSFGIAYGKHSRIEPLRIYLIEIPVDGIETLSNKNLEITKAHHFVLAYDWLLNPNMHFKVEPYVQLLYDVPVSPDSSFSMINYQNEMYFNSALDNSGTGINYGIDFTFERFMNKGYYYMATASIYESKYKGGDGIERNTRLNQNYVLNLLGGKEWKIGQSNFISVNGKFTVLGGTPYTPPNQEASQAASAVVYDMNLLYAEKWNTNYYLDLSINYRINRPKVSHNFNIQAKNLTMQTELLGFAYDYADKYAVPQELAIVLPYLSYKIVF